MGKVAYFWGWGPHNHPWPEPKLAQALHLWDSCKLVGLGRTLSQWRVAAESQDMRPPVPVRLGQGLALEQAKPHCSGPSAGPVPWVLPAQGC